MEKTKKRLIIFMPSMDGGGVEKNLIIVSNFLSRYIKNLTLITFDDGFKNNYNVAYKILKKIFKLMKIVVFINMRIY